MNEKKRELWKERIQEFNESKLSQKEFARQGGLSVNTLQYWLRKAKAEPDFVSSTDWLEVKKPEPAPKASPMILEIDGVRIALMEDFDPEFLKNVIRTLKQP
jgi:transcriptional regulator with XRE-family HTH domain